MKLTLWTELKSHVPLVWSQDDEPTSGWQLVEHTQVTMSVNKLKEYNRDKSSEQKVKYLQQHIERKRTLNLPCAAEWCLRYSRLMVTFLEIICLIWCKADREKQMISGYAAGLEDIQHNYHTLVFLSLSASEAANANIPRYSSGSLSDSKAFCSFLVNVFLTSTQKSFRKE